MKFLALPLVFYIIFPSAVAGFGDVTEEEWIQNYLADLKKSSYDKRIAPDGNGRPGTPVKVSASMYIIDINKVDDSNMDFNAQFYFRQIWNDSRLQYKDRKENLILRNVEEIWTPDLFFVEEREGSLHQITHPNIFCRIKPDGEVRYSMKLSVTFGCPMDLRLYPHDVQKCQINVESYGYERKHIYVDWSQEHTPLLASDTITMLEFDLIEYTPSASNISFTFGEYSRLEIHLKFQRKFGFFAIRLYVPFILLVLMSLLSLWVKAEERCLRLALLLVILYLMVTISSEVNSFIPPAPYTKASDVWIGFCESLVFAVFLEFVLVALIAGKDNGEDGSKSKGEILLSLDPEAKEQTLNADSLKSPLSKLINMFDARNGGNGRRNASAYRIDKVCRIVFPIIFIIFNIVYWSVYCCA